mmetsp:Transcript_46386/g.135116  ORF Transcript_46386/g.135116 Transcript_46386/m.135116 type:complete len:205 (+) Transcript_46386:478-1092(+)
MVTSGQTSCSHSCIFCPATSPSNTTRFQMTRSPHEQRQTVPPPAPAEWPAWLGALVVLVAITRLLSPGVRKCAAPALLWPRLMSTRATALVELAVAKQQAATTARKANRLRGCGCRAVDRALAGVAATMCSRPRPGRLSRPGGHKSPPAKVWLRRTPCFQLRCTPGAHGKRPDLGRHLPRGLGPDEGAAVADQAGRRSPEAKEA